MNEPLDSFDWSSLGDEPLPGEMDDEALLGAVLGQAAAAPQAPATAEAGPRWIKPAVAAVVLLAAAAVLVVFAPSWTEALMGEREDGTIAPDVEAPRDDDGQAQRMHAQDDARAAKRRMPAVELPEPEPEAEPEPEPEAEPEAPSLAPRPRPARKDPPASADQLLREAQDAMAAKDTKGAIRKYGALVRAHPSSAEARAARVSLGRLELKAGRAKKALAHFDRYLEGNSGGLRREAELGRIDALRKLGRKDAERKAIETFLADHPSTVHAQRLRTRLEALQ